MFLGIFSTPRCCLRREEFLTSFPECALGCHASLYRYARSLCREPREAEELLQETYTRALGAKHKPDCSSAEALRPWMFTIMRHVWQNERRRQSRVLEISLDENDGLSIENPELLLGQKLLLSEVREAMDSLPIHMREIVVMRDVEDLTYSEIASVLEIPVGTVMSRLSRARMALRQVLTSKVPAREAWR
jgi:RNA polymerase sigma-70 factor (ECF subfamily)